MLCVECDRLFLLLLKNKNELRLRTRGALFLN
uniref:Uncharacterized protein n=1 Tax=Anguilla anguilla TaxID=7936 RepID=A0A0E9SS50_ANGAN